MAGFEDSQEPCLEAYPAAEVDEHLPGAGHELVSVYDLKIDLVRAALSAVGIKVDDPSNKGRCKAALANYLVKLNNTASEVQAIGAQDPVVSDQPTPPAALDAFDEADFIATAREILRQQDPVPS